MCVNLRHGVDAESLLAGKNDAGAPLLGQEVFLRKVRVLQRISRKDQGVALVHELDGLAVAGHDGQHVVRIQEVGAADLVALRDGNARGTEPLSIVLIFWL